MRFSVISAYTYNSRLPSHLFWYLLTFVSASRIISLQIYLCISLLFGLIQGTFHRLRHPLLCIVITLTRFNSIASFKLTSRRRPIRIASSSSCSCRTGTSIRCRQRRPDRWCPVSHRKLHEIIEIQSPQPTQFNK